MQVCIVVQKLYRKYTDFRASLSICNVCGFRIFRTVQSFLPPEVY